MPETTTRPAILERLAARAGDGYGLARILGRIEGDRSADPFALLASDGVPVLREARGALGVLRALEFRCGPLLRGFAETGETVDLVHWTPDAPRVIHRWTVRVRPDNVRE